MLCSWPDNPCTGTRFDIQHVYFQDPMFTVLDRNFLVSRGHEYVFQGLGYLFMMSFVDFLDLLRGISFRNLLENRDRL